MFDFHRLLKNTLISLREIYEQDRCVIYEQNRYDLKSMILPC